MNTLRLFLIFHFSFFVFHCSFAQSYGWKDISKNLPDYPFDTTIINGGEDTLIAHISDISFINGDEGWVTTWHAFADENAAILHTNDGGETWEVQTVIRPCQVIHIVNENVGYACSDGGLIFKTNDGGTSWAFHGITGAPITAMSFVPGSDTGYVCSYMSSILQQITPELVNPISLGNSDWWKSISAPSHELIWISGGTSIWTFDEEGLTDQPVASTFFSSIDFVQNNLGWGVGHDGVKEKNPGTISGCVGKNIPWVHLKYTEQPLYEVFALDENHVWAAGFEGYIYYSENASDFGFDTLSSTGWSDVNFISQPNPRPDVDFHSLFFTSPQNGFVSGGENVLLKFTQITGMEEQGGMPARPDGRSGGEAWGQGGVEVFPNPSSGIFNLQFTIYNLQSVRIEIVDVYGRVLESSNNRTIEQLNNGAMQFDITHLPAGVYFVRITIDNQLMTKKIVRY